MDSHSRIYSTIGFAAVLLVVSLQACPQEQESTAEPKVREAVPAEVYEADLRHATGEQLAPKWQPGDPVRVVEDLKSTDESDMSSKANKPVVREASRPDSSSVKLKDLPQVEPYEEGDPVRVVEDLKRDAQDNEEKQEDEHDQDDQHPNAG